VSIVTTPTAPAAVVRLWRLELDVPGRELDRLARVLTPAEHERAGRLRFRRSRDRYVAGRGQLRRVLASLTGARPEALELATNPFGKPQLPGSGLFFNLAHCQGRALLAVTTAGRIGVDLEQLRALPDRDLIAERFFAASEVAAVRRVTPQGRDAAFLRCWTRKEAYVKAVGDGLSQSLQDFAVSVDPAEEPRLVWSRIPSERLRWSVLDLSDHCPGHLAAAVLEAPRASVCDGRDTTRMECR